MTTANYSVDFSAVLSPVSGDVVVGDVLVLSDTGVGYVISTTANRGTRRSSGIARSAGTSGQQVVIQPNGEVSASVVGLLPLAGPPQYAVTTALGRLARSVSFTAADEVVGMIDEFGNFAASFAGGVGTTALDGKTVVVMADADQVLTDPQGRNGLVQTTGVLTANRRLTFTLPSAAASSYSTPVLNTCTGASIIVSVGTGNTVYVEPGSKALIQITASGVTCIVDLPLDPRDFGCPWDGVEDDLPGLILMQQCIPASTGGRTTKVQIPKAQGWISDNLEIFRKIVWLGYGQSYQNATAGLNQTLINGLRVPPLKGFIIHGETSAADIADSGGVGNAHNTRFSGVNVTCQSAIVSDAVGNWGRSMNHLDTTYDIWEHQPVRVSKGSVCLKSGVAGAALTVGSSNAEYYGDGHSRDTTHLYWFRCTTAGTPGPSKPAPMSSGSTVTIGQVVPAVSPGTASWIVESVPKDYANSASIVAGQRCFLPGDNAHVFIALTAGTTQAGEATTLHSDMNGLTIPATIKVASTDRFPSTGIIRVVTTSGFQFVTYGGKTATTFTICSKTVNLPNLAGTMATGGAVTGPYDYAPWGVPVIARNQMHQPNHRASFYDVTGAGVGAQNLAALPGNVFTVASTACFADAGTLHIWTGAAYASITYTGRTDTTFTGCSAGTGTSADSGEVGQGVFWQEEHSGVFAVLASWVTIEECQISGATNGAWWVSPSYKRAFSGGSHYFAFRDNYVQNCGQGFKQTSFNSNGGETNHNQFDFIGGGRTNVDGPAYLNVIPAVTALNWPLGRFGNGGDAITDRQLGLCIHKNSYTQFSGGQGYRNDVHAAGATAPSGNSTTWDHNATENDLRPNLIFPAVVRNPPHGISPASSATVFGAASRWIRTASPLRTDATKSINAVVGPQDDEMAGAFRMQHTDDGYPIDWHCSEDLTSWHAGWFVFGKSLSRGWTLEQMIAVPRYGATMPGSHSLGGLTPPWICQNYALFGLDPSVPPNALGFSPSRARLGIYGDWTVAGSVLFNTTVTSNSDPLAWRSTVSGAPGTWTTIFAPQRGEDTIAMADANKTPTAEQNARRTLILTGALTGDRTLFLAVPAFNNEGAEFVIDASGISGANIVADIVGHVGTTVTIAAGKTATVRTYTGGVKRQTADV